MSSASPAHSDSGLSGDKSKKYDRQLRLWGDHGQVALETARVCLINATATGTEILKNLILPGVGSFTIVDDKKVGGDDIGNNFFLDKDSLGKARAQVTTELLLELNEDVNGDFVEENVETLLENNSSFFTNFSVVIATSLPEKPLLQLSALLWQQDVPLLSVASIGLVSWVRIAVPEHCIVESHPDDAINDLRLDVAFPLLTDYCDAINMAELSKKDHSHTPWLVIIYKFLQQWKEQHDGHPPKNYQEKKQMKELIRTGIRTNDEGVPEDEENFEEALRNVNTALLPTSLPDSVKTIFNDEACTSLNADSKPFWILARALKEFVENEGNGCLPLRGAIPDMTADSERYIALQGVYREQASQHIASITNHLHELEQNLGQDGSANSELRGQSESPPRKSPDGITENDIRTFCKNASFLRVVRSRSFQQEYQTDNSKITDLAYNLEDEDSEFVHYVMLRAVQRFYTEYNRYPGQYAETVDGDVPKLKACTSKLTQEWGLTSCVKDDFIQEYCRYGASELHSVAAYMGGCAAQEAIKLLTRQFVPINNLYIYNAAKQTSLTLEV